MFEPLNDGVYSANFPVKIRKGAYIGGFVFCWNPCCPDRPVVITGSLDDDSRVRFTAQCSCGRWHTSKFNSEGEAIREYEDLASLYEKLKCWAKEAADRVGDQEDVGNN